MYLRHAKVVLCSRRYPRKNFVACIGLGIASFGGSFPREDSMEQYRQCGTRTLLLLRCLCLRSCFARLPPSTGKVVVLVRNWRQIFLCCLGLDVLLAAGCWLMINCELYGAGRHGGLSSGYLRMLFALVLVFACHRCEIWHYLQKCKQ